MISGAPHFWPQWLNEPGSRDMRSKHGDNWISTSLKARIWCLSSTLLEHRRENLKGGIQNSFPMCGAGQRAQTDAQIADVTPAS